MWPGLKSCSTRDWGFGSAVGLNPKIHLPLNFLDHTGIGSVLDPSTTSTGELHLPRGTAACPNAGSSLLVWKAKDLKAKVSQCWHFAEIFELDFII